MGALSKIESIWEVTWVVPVKVTVGGVAVKVVNSALEAEAIVGAVPAAKVKAETPDKVVLVSMVW